MKPYYEEKGITIYHGDCREVLPSLAKVDLVLTDPPYGINHDPQRFRRWSGAPSRHARIVGDDVKFDPSLLFGLSKHVITWGANYYSDVLPLGGCLVWDKRCSDHLDRMIGHPIEIAWNSFAVTAIARIHHGGVVNADSYVSNNQGRWHPTQKPIRLMAWCIQRAPDAETILDPFMGSGTTLRAAKDLGRHAIGIEIEERYCEIAANRLRQEVLPFENVA